MNGRIFQRLVRASFLSGGPSITLRHAGLKRSIFSLRQATILSSLGICQKERLKTSGVQAGCSSCVPLWPKQLLALPRKSATANGAIAALSTTEVFTFFTIAHRLRAKPNLGHMPTPRVGTKA